MLAAEIHKKISHSYPPHQRMEDVLTSSILSLFRYLNILSLPTEFLNHAVNIKGGTLGIKEFAWADVYFWPKFRLATGAAVYREPDVVLYCCEKESRDKWMVVIEAKYDAQLSNIRTKEEDEPEESDKECYGHQLADQFCGSLCGIWDIPNEECLKSDRTILLYITPNYEPPLVDMKEAVENICARKCSNARKKCGPSAEGDIYWVSWRALDRVIRSYSTSDFAVYTNAELHLIEDIGKLLEVRGLQVFEPFKKLLAVERYDCSVKPVPRKENVLWSRLHDVGSYPPGDGIKED